MRAYRVVAGVAAGLVVLAYSVPGLAAETITYSYDVLGRLITVAHSGSVNNNLQSAYQYDPADNRGNVSVTGASK